ncbi:MAG: hypothetical protein Q9227_001902 [Pyrenula ochraceoflavens]
MALPAEVRQMVYKILLHKSEPIYISVLPSFCFRLGANFTSILLTCTSVYLEAAPTLYSINTFEATNVRRFVDDFLPAIGAINASDIRTLQITGRKTISTLNFIKIAKLQKFCPNLRKISWPVLNNFRLKGCSSQQDKSRRKLRQEVLSVLHDMVCTGFISHVNLSEYIGKTYSVRVLLFTNPPRRSDLPKVGSCGLFILVVNADSGQYQKYLPLNVDLICRMSHQPLKERFEWEDLVLAEDGIVKQAAEECLICTRRLGSNSGA